MAVDPIDRSDRSGLAESARALELALSGVTDMSVIAFDRELVVTEAHGGLLDRWGWGPDRMLGRSLPDLLPTATLAILRGPYAEALEGRPAKFSFPSLDGRAHFEVSVDPLRDERSGEVLGGVAVTREVTPLEGRDPAGEARMAAVLEAATEYSIIATGLDGKITVFNSGAEKMLGYDAAEMIGFHSTDLIHDPVEITTRAAELGIEPDVLFSTRAGDGQIDTERWTYVRKDGSRLEVMLTVTEMRGPDGTLEGYIGIATDVSEQLAAERELRRSRHEFALTFENAPVGLALQSARPSDRGRYIRVNDALCQITGFSREELLARSFVELTHPEDRTADADAAIELAAGRLDRYRNDKRYIHRDGHSVEVSVGVALLRDDDGQPSHYVSQVQDISARKRYERRLTSMADHDPLTGLLNRSRFEGAVEDQIATGARCNEASAILMVDLDNFREVNERFGQAAGDELLGSVARIMQSRLRDTDLLARIGGDEFAILLPGASAEKAETIATELSDRIRERVTFVDGKAGGITASIGVTELDKTRERDVAELMSESETAMGTAKSEGRNRIARYNRDADDRLIHSGARTTMRSQIQQALERDCFELYLQPVVSLSPETQERYEVLLRMRGDDGTLIAPGIFLPVAERSRQINEIDHWVINRAIDLLGACRREGRDISLEVNLSGRSIGDESIAELVDRRLGAEGIDPERLIIEITETAAVENIEQAKEFGLRLMNLGCKFALDDFGAGFGSFYYLKHLPFDFLKIDGEFVKGCTDSRTDQLVIQSCVQLAKGLGKETIAEFVEDDSILNLVRALGVDHAQGYGLGRPVPLSETTLPSMN